MLDNKEATALLDEYRENYERDCIQTRWQIIRKQIEEIKGYQISNFKFLFNLTGEKNLEDFIDFLDKYRDKDTFPLHPIDFADFLQSKNIKFKVKFEFIIGNSFKTNLYLLKIYLYLKIKY